MDQGTHRTSATLPDTFAHELAIAVANTDPDDDRACA